MNDPFTSKPNDTLISNQEIDSLDEKIKEKQKKLILLELEEKIKKGKARKQKSDKKDFAITVEEIAYKRYKLEKISLAVSVVAVFVVAILIFGGIILNTQPLEKNEEQEITSFLAQERENF